MLASQKNHEVALQLKNPTTCALNLDTYLQVHVTQCELSIQLEAQYISEMIQNVHYKKIKNQIIKKSLLTIFKVKLFFFLLALLIVATFPVS